MKLVSTLILLMALFCSTVLADGNMGGGGRATLNDTKVTVKGGMTTEDGDPPPPPPPCVPSPEAACDGGNMGGGGRSTFDFIQEYLSSFFD
jgi:hypothetical protein